VPSLLGWIIEPRCRLTVRKVSGNTMVGYKRLRNLWRLVKKIIAQPVPGAIVECGCWRGGSSALMKVASANKKQIWVFDSFQSLKR
jgi:hypothetical protein